MVSSILTPGTIFLLILGAINLAYPRIDLWVALVLNIIPIAIMVLLCFISKSEVQVNMSHVIRKQVFGVSDQVKANSTGSNQVD